MSEKIGSAKGSRLDEDFVELERVSIGSIKSQVGCVKAVHGRLFTCSVSLKA